MQKTIYVKTIDKNVIIAKRKGTRSLKIAIRSDGTIRLTVPYLVTERQAIKFLEQKADWIKEHHKQPERLYNQTHIGKSHMLYFQQADIDMVKTRLLTNKIVVKIPGSMNIADDEVQKAAKKACERALKKEADKLLPQRLEILAEKQDVSYKSCSVKKLKSRWGSCDSRKNIILNIYLIQLDWHLIDYVIIHELAHTKHQHHQAEFWSYVSRMMPDYKERRKIIKTMKTDVVAT
jgi:predicted metal-dependent hydrolase